MTTKPAEWMQRPPAERFYAAEDSAGDYYFRLANVPLMHESHRKLFEYVIASEYDAQAADIKRLTEELNTTRLSAILCCELHGCTSEKCTFAAYHEDAIQLQARMEAAESTNASLVERVKQLHDALEEIFDDLPEDRCADPNCGGECGVYARAKAALAPAEEKANGQ